MSLPRSQAIALPPTPMTADCVMMPPAPSLREQGSFFQEQFQFRTRERQCMTPCFANLQRLLIELYRSNVGLLLIAASQLFMTFMNVAVKFLNDLEDPVPTLEVRAPELKLFRSRQRLICSWEACLGSHGEHPCDRANCHVLTLMSLPSDGE